MSTKFSKGWQGEKICKDCGNKFIAKSGSSRFCDDCKKKKMICPECGNHKSIYDKFCGNSCAGKWKYKNSDKVRNAIKLGLEKAHKNASERTKRLLTGKPKPNFMGDKNPNWKGGVYGTERHRDMGRVEYIEWRKSIYLRDSYTCSICGETGGRLNAHHIKSWKNFPEFRYSINNGATLCKNCHKEVHKNKASIQLKLNLI